MRPAVVPIGARFGRLVVIGRGKNIRDKRGVSLVTWTCRCDCGSIKTLRRISITTGNSTGCGCLQRIGKPLSDPTMVSKNNLWSKYRAEATHRGIAWSLTRDEFDRLVFMECHYCKSAPAREHNAYLGRNGKPRPGRKQYVKDLKSATILYNGIDRKNNSAGYEALNCVSCCWTCNKMKGDMNVADFIRHTSKIGEHLRGAHA